MQQLLGGRGRGLQELGEEGARVLTSRGWGGGGREQQMSNNKSIRTSTKAAAKGRLGAAAAVAASGCGWLWKQGI